ncbi:MAG: hypothetical protein WAU15_02655 [Nitrosomonas sp.]
MIQRFLIIECTQPEVSASLSYPFWLPAMANALGGWNYLSRFSTAC